MERFQWTPGCTVFHAQCDDEHRELYGLGEQLHQAMQTGNREAIEHATRRLSDAMDEHFTHEERLMRAARYAGYVWHKSQHDAARRYIAGLMAAPDELLLYLTGWFRDHTGIADRMMASCLRNAARRGQTFTAT
jgi:hemerythrin-like metal-binding protein